MGQVHGPLSSPIYNAADIIVTLNTKWYCLYINIILQYRELHNYKILSFGSMFACTEWYEEEKHLRRRQRGPLSMYDENYENDVELQATRLPPKTWRWIIAQSMTTQRVAGHVWWRTHDGPIMTVRVTQGSESITFPYIYLFWKFWIQSMTHS